MFPRVSIVVPCFNVEDYVESALDSITNQTLKEIEIICIDDGSTDNTRAILNRISKYESRVRLILSDVNQGSNLSRNIGLKHAKAPYIQFLDSDDLLMSSKLEVQSMMLEKGDFDIVAGNYMNEKGEEEGLEETEWIGLFLSKLGYTSANLFRTEAVRKVGGWNPGIRSSQEYYLMFSMLSSGAKVCFSIQPLTVKRSRPTGQISTRDPMEYWLRYIDLRREIIHYLNDQMPEFYLKSEKRITNELFNLSRYLARYDLKIAEKLKEEFIPNDFIPSVGPVNSKMYVKLYRLGGFVFAERIKRILTLFRG